MNRFVIFIFLTLLFRVPSICQCGLLDQLCLHLGSIVHLDFAIMTQLLERLCICFLQHRLKYFNESWTQLFTQFLNCYTEINNLKVFFYITNYAFGFPLKTNRYVSILIYISVCVLPNCVCSSYCVYIPGVWCSHLLTQWIAPWVFSEECSTMCHVCMCR